MIKYVWRHYRILCFATLALALGASSVGCKKDTDADKEAAPGAEEKPPELFRFKGKHTPFTFQLPIDWEAESVTPDTVPEPFAQDPDKDPEVKLSGRLVFAAKASDSRRKPGGVPPRIQIFHDPWLPVGTTATDYLKAQRETNERAIKDAQDGTRTVIRHVEAERSRREGRPAYYVRDEWDFLMGEQKVTVSQETLLLIEQQGEALHGYSIVITMLEEDKKVLGPSVREMLDTVAFE